MTLRKQVITLLVALTLVLITITYAVQVWVVMPAFGELEYKGAARNVERCADAIKRDIHAISNQANDWAAWDDSYRFIVDHNEDFITANLTKETFQNLHIHLLCFIDLQHNIVWGESRDMETSVPIEAGDIFDTLRQPDYVLTKHANPEDAKQGILQTSMGPMLVASRPSLTTSRQGPIRGSVIMGRFLNAEEVAGLADRMRISLNVWSQNDPATPPEVSKWMAASSRAKRPIIDLLDNKVLHAYACMEDVEGKPALGLQVETPREVTQQGRVAAIAATACGIGGGILTLIVMGCVLQWQIVGPLQSMAAHAERVGKNDDLKARLHFQRDDEIGTLAKEFDSMVSSLDESRKKVLDTAHRAGMAEIASEVLHNVGNAANSANCSINCLHEQIHNSKLSGLERATSMLSEQAPRAAEFFGTDPRGPKLVEYLVGLEQSLREEQECNRAEVSRLRGTLQHICEAIASQQSVAGRCDFRQDVELPNLIAEVLKLNEDLIRSSEVQVTLDLAPLPELQLNKSKTVQILVNLVRNAVQAMAHQPSDRRHLTIAARSAEDDSLELEVTDTGMGFDEEVRSKLFTHGFTTKPEGNGFGLHYCANAVREQGGHISAQSAGRGQGATFRIRLPHVLPASCATTT
ncbi:MAG: HAMP domain-containing protein [Pirellulales bacterium]|nr:HAMP domain-containing protein [Pirellulales bacterium]